MSTISIEDILKIITGARDQLGKGNPSSAMPQSPTAGPPGGQDQPGFLGDPGINTTPPGAPAAGPATSDPGLEAPTNPRTHPYGHLATLTPEQAQAFQTLMLIQGHNGDTVGRGRVVPHPTSTGPAQAAL